MKFIARCFFLVAFGAVLIGCSEQPETFKQLLVYPNQKPIEAFKLKAHTGNDFTQESFRSRWNLVFVGYTHCPDVCPMTLNDMSKIYQAIPESLQKKFQFTFLSVDPKRDTVEHLAQYISHFEEDFVAITGEKEEIDKLVFSIGGVYAINSESEDYYSVDHSGRIFIISPQAKRFGIISSEAMHDKDKSIVIEDLIKLAN
ncbi:SCO family protein [Aliikangiella sp. G2MR2-5]|uniref:SCO family protein n=1 Tax=Aliikangiella sp. G2MR2-5 TaxID=2788943 RepID=UPI0018AC4209|nr:SCO family protein [Aliikangiella sp. G2MR2-5]